ncbi:MAG: HlyD family efflux transporter periplasmic adaptor subunit [Lachnospiraceae bacterium]|nr:HlyD family efflux transporter periplasmic adaptor subunit [Lachnospiraceae bacterium]MCI9202514.1 HlyD family efflux transporter periplasmic adaptor subunit [Lachnospiraceae bacterium]
MRFIKEKKRTVQRIILLLLFIMIGAAIITVMSFPKEDKTLYRESQVIKGNLARGVTESGSVDVGTAIQAFDLDISEFTGSGNFTFGMGGQGGDMMTGMMPEASDSGSASDRQLEIEQVYVEAGQEIESGTPILKLTRESVEGIRTELSQDVTEAELVYQQALTSQKQTEADAQGEYKLNALYAGYSQAEYDETVSTLTQAVEKAQEDLTETEEELSDAQQELTEKEALLAEEKKVLENALFTAKGTDKENALYWWVIAQQTAGEAQKMADTLEDEIRQLEKDIEDYREKKTENETALALAQKELESGEITARGELDKRKYNAENAQEIYDVAVEQSAFETETAREDYEEAVGKLEEFDSVIVEQVISADHSGVVTEVYVAAGNYLNGNMDLISLNNYDEVTITLSVEEDDLEAAALGNTANVTMAAFEDEVFTATVTEIGDAEIDSNTNKTMYAVTVTVQNTGNVLYQDMTAEVTFVTDEVSEVLYIPVRAVTQENGADYAKVREEDGTIVRKKVTTGFTDGINIEIKEGLCEGETVLTESKVKI